MAATQEHRLPRKAVFLCLKFWLFGTLHGRPYVEFLYFKLRGTLIMAILPVWIFTGIIGL